MGLILGIDTGGTYTDSVLLDPDTKKIFAKAKAFTTQEDLAVGIKKSIEGLKTADASRITKVILSTTLATNAVVEGKGQTTGLILLGRKIDKPTPALCSRLISGRIGPKGGETSPVNEAEVRDVVGYFLNHGVRAVAVSGFLSVRNPVHEIAVRESIRRFTGLPVVCGHELATELGFYERTVTAVLNAGLLPIITGFAGAIQSVLQDCGIDAPAYIVRGDGSILTLGSIADVPVETILSGPAASALGAMYLSGESNAVIADMGGTTTDTILLRDRRVRLSPQGACVGGWQTRVKSAEIHTHGLGGDSKILYDVTQGFTVGPNRVLPACRGEKESRQGCVTPTDLLHVTGEFRRWDAEQAREAVSRMAAQAGRQEGEILSEAGDEVSRLLFEKCIRPYKEADDPVIAVGAPAALWFKKAAERYGFRVIIPPHFEVAGAIGAAAAEVNETATAIIRPGEGQQGFVAHFQRRRELFHGKEEAVARATEILKEEALAQAKKQGARNIELSVFYADTFTDWITDDGKKGKRYVETKITVVAAGGKLT